jgi:hypothetical protein
MHVDIKFAEPTHYFDSRGRNFPTYGVAIHDMGNGEFAEVHLHSIGQRGRESEASRVTVAKSAIPDLVGALLDTLPPAVVVEVLHRLLARTHEPSGQKLFRVGYPVL